MPRTKAIVPTLEHDDIDEEEFYLAQTAGMQLEEEKPKFKPGDTVYVKKGKKRIKRVVGDRFGTGKHEGKILTLGGRSGKEEYWELPAALELCSLTVETALLQPEELLGALDEQAFTSATTIALHFDGRYDECQILALAQQLKKDGSIVSQLCPDGKTYLWRKRGAAENESIAKI